MTAYHEVGHALMGVLLPFADPLHKVTIIPRGFALGVTMLLPDEDVLSRTRRQLIDSIGVCLGGRVAEELVYGDVTTGAQNDLEKSTKLARRMVTEFGMSDKLGPQTFGKRNEHVFLGRDFGHERDYGENIATMIDEEVSTIVGEQYTRVKDVLAKHRPHMDAVVAVLLEKETLDRLEVDAILAEVNRKLAAGEPLDTPPSDNIAPPPPSVTVEDESTKIKISTPQMESGDGPPPELKPKFA